MNAIKQQFPCNTLLVDDVSFTFNNSQSSDQKSISDLTGGIVTSSNIKGFIVSVFGGFALSTSISNKQKIQLNLPTGTYSGTLKASILFMY